MVSSGKEEVLNRNYWLTSLATLLKVPVLCLDSSPTNTPSSK